MPNTDKWIDVSGLSFPIEIDRPTARKSAHIRLVVSPYDVPRAVRGRYDELMKRFVIDLLYITKDEPREASDENGLQLLRGRNSGRIYSIIVDVDGQGLDGVGLDIVHEVQERVTSVLDDRMSTGGGSRSANARAVKQTLATTPQVYEELAASR